ncbi:MAG: hypothetical protein U5N86_03035 [Planctomycetota bacterium]|nr:hypothetical protein [Planctomycetota bacterium]
MRFLQGFDLDAPPPSEAEKARAQKLKGIEHLRTFRELSIDSGAGRILKARMVQKLCEAYGLNNTFPTPQEVRSRYLQSLKVKVFEEVDRARRSGDPSDFLSLARRAFLRKSYELAYRLYFEYLNYISSGFDGDRERAEQGFLEATDKVCNEVPREEREKLEELYEHDAFEKLVYLPTRHFVLMGPKDFVRAIPENSAVNFDISHLIESDLLATPEKQRGKRILVYMRELYGIGGGQARGDVIMISLKYAKQYYSAKLIDQHLYFHELAHCFAPLFPIKGLNEGIADLGSQICLEMFGKPEANDLRRNAENRFMTSFVNAGLPFTQIPNYAPSHGFFAHPLLKAGFENGISKWSKLRGAFRDLRNYPIPRQTTWQWTRHYFKALEPYFGKDVYSLYADAGFDITPESRFVLQDELEQYEDELQYSRFQGLMALILMSKRLAKENPLSYYRHKATLEALALASELQDKSSSRELSERAGVVRNALLLGPFRETSEGTDLPVSGAYTNPCSGEKWMGMNGSVPEQYLDADKVSRPKVDADGYYRITNTLQLPTRYVLAAYTPKLAGAWDGILWLNCDRSFALWIDDEIVLRSQCPALFSRKYDSHRIPVSLSAGHHRIALSFSASSEKSVIRIRLTGTEGSRARLLPLSPAYPLNHNFKRPPLLEQSETIFFDSFGDFGSTRNWDLLQALPDLDNGVLRFKKAAARLFRYKVSDMERGESNLGLLWLRKARPREPYSAYVEFKNSETGGDRHGVVIFDGNGEDTITSGITVHVKRSGNRVGVIVYRFEQPLLSHVSTVSGSATGVKVSRYGEWLWVEVNGNTYIHPFRIRGVPDGRFGVAFSRAFALNTVEIRRLQKP